MPSPDTDALSGGMMTMAHTPGPWLIAGLTVYALHHNGGWSDGKPFLVNRFYARVEGCVGQGGTEAEANANARLIAASPELLAACEAADAYWTFAFPEGPDGQPPDGMRRVFEDHAIEWRKVRAAIAKARATGA